MDHNTDVIETPNFLKNKRTLIISCQILNSQSKKTNFMIKKKNSGNTYGIKRIGIIFQVQKEQLQFNLYIEDVFAEEDKIKSVTT